MNCRNFYVYEEVSGTLQAKSTGGWSLNYLNPVFQKMEGGDMEAGMSIYMLKLRHTGTPNIGGGEGPMVGEDVSYTLATGQDQTMFQPEGDGYIVRRLTPKECERLQGFPDGHTDLTGFDPEALLAAMPAEEDGKERGKVERNVRKWCAACPDAPRYKACGNSMAVPVIRWLGERIEMVDALVEDLVMEGY